MCFASVLFTKWNGCIFHSKQRQNEDPAFSHMLFIGQKIVSAYVFEGQFCLFANLQFHRIFFLPKIYVDNVMFAIHFLKVHAIGFQMRPSTKYLVQKFLVWGKAQYCYVKISRLSARPFVPWDHTQAKTVPMNLIWSESALWLWRSSVRKIPGALIMAMGMPIMLPWTNDHDVAHLQAKTVQMNSIQNKSAQWLRGYGVCKIAGANITPWAHPLCPHGQMTMTLHIYRPRRFQWSWFVVNRPMSYRVSASRFQEPLSRPWACPLYPHG